MTLAGAVARTVSLSAAAQAADEALAEGGEPTGERGDRCFALRAQHVALHFAPEGVAVFFGQFILSRLLNEFVLKFHELVELPQFP